MTAHRHPRSLFAAAAGLPLAAAALAALNPEFWDRASSEPAVFAAVSLSLTALPFGLYLLGFRDLGRSSRVPKAVGYLVFMLAAAATALVLALLLVDGIASGLLLLLAWSGFCSVSWPLYWSRSSGREPAGETLVARACLALLCALAASGANAAAAFGLHSYIKEVGARTTRCRSANDSEAQRLRRDSARSPDLDAELRACSKPGYRFMLAGEERPRPGRRDWEPHILSVTRLST